jgi:GDP-mannose 6-dehydrogenase
MRVSVFGLGYVGCVTAACLARAGHDVMGVDVNPDKVDSVKRGASPVVEPGLGDLIAAMVSQGRLRATGSVEEAVSASDLALICVGTPARANGQPDFTAVERVGEQIGCALSARPTDFTVVLRSTVLPGTTERLLRPALKAGAGAEAAGRVRMAVNPEFMREGSSLQDFVAPPLTLVGCDDGATAALLQELYAGVSAPFVHTALSTAEMVKYSANAFHALKVCFANEVGDVCASLGVDAHEVMRVFLMDRKLNVSEAYLRPGFAFGGSCLPKDVRGLLYAAASTDVVVPLLSAILPSNDAQVRRGIEAVLETKRKRVGVVGLSFKPGTDDLRESPMVRVVEALIGKGCDVRILDRSVSIARLTGANRRYIEEEIPHISSLLCDDTSALLAHAQVLVIGNGGEEAAAVLAGTSAEQIVVDLTRGMAQARRNREGA